MEKLFGFLSPVIVYLFIFALNALLPGRWVIGYVSGKNPDEKLKYRLNGLTVLVTVVILWVILCYSGVIAWDWLYIYRWYALAGAVISGLIFSILMVVTQAPVSKLFIIDFFLGRAENPQMWGGRIDAKMWLYLVGAVMLELNILSFAAHHYILYGSLASPGIYLSTALLTWFIIDYLTFEEVHLYTYDFFAERVGFKLGWGCIAFYPFFYSVPIWTTVELPPVHNPAWLMVTYVILFAASWILSRGANLQKYHFKKDPLRPFMGIKPRVISDGERSLLVNGFWGLSRHVNYLGEIGMATAIVLSVGHPLLPWPWLYPAYYILLLFTREYADNKRCSLKYGPLWDQYKRSVPYRIIPYIY